MSSKEVGSFAIKNIIKTLRNCRLSFFGSFFNLNIMEKLLETVLIESVCFSGKEKIGEPILFEIQFIPQNTEELELIKEFYLNLLKACKENRNLKRL